MENTIINCEVKHKVIKRKTSLFVLKTVLKVTGMVILAIIAACSLIAAGLWLLMTFGFEIVAGSAFALFIIYSLISLIINFSKEKYREESVKYDLEGVKEEVRDIITHSINTISIGHEIEDEEKTNRELTDEENEKMRKYFPTLSWRNYILNDLIYFGYICHDDINKDMSWGYITIENLNSLP